MQFRAPVKLFNFFVTMFIFAFIIAAFSYQHTGNVILSGVLGWISTGFFTLCAFVVFIMFGRDSYAE